MKKIDFIHTCPGSKKQWRIKSASSLDEYLAALHLRRKVYLEQGYFSVEELESNDSYVELVKYLKEQNYDPYDGLYEIDAYDRFPEYANNNFDSTKLHTEQLIALEKSEFGELSIDGGCYTLAGAVRVVRDDTELSLQPLGLPVEENVDIKSIKAKNLKKNRRFCEASRLVKKENTDKYMTNGLLRAITNLTLYGDIYCPDTIIVAPEPLERYYNGVGCRRLLPEAFNYKKMSGVHKAVALNIEMNRVKIILSFAGIKPIRVLIARLFPRFDATLYSSTRLE